MLSAKEAIDTSKTIDANLHALARCHSQAYATLLHTLVGTLNDPDQRHQTGYLMDLMNCGKMLPNIRPTILGALRGLGKN